MAEENRAFLGILSSGRATSDKGFLMPVTDLVEIRNNKKIKKRETNHKEQFSRAFEPVQPLDYATL